MIHSEEYLECYLPKNRLKLAINVGAHHGLWVERLAPIFDQVIAIEGNPESAAKIEAMKLENVSVLALAGWIVSGHEMPFNIHHGDGQGCALACRDIQRESNLEKTIQVLTVAIDDIQKSACDLIWIDTEGADLQVLQGATRTIEQYKPVIVLECHESENRDWAQSWLNRCGYNTAIVHNPSREQNAPDWDRNSHLVATYWRSRGIW